MDYFIVSSNILKRDDLSIYEKMCCIALSMYDQSEEESISLSDLANDMGVDEITARSTFYSLRKKGVIKTESGIKPGTIIKAKDVIDHIPIEEVMELVDEQITEREAKIICAFAKNDLNLIKEKYHLAKKSQFSDKIEVLINELQKKEQKTERKEEKIIKEKKTNNLQVNSYKLNLMKKYGKK